MRVFEAPCPLQRLILALHLLHEIPWARHGHIEIIDFLAMVFVRYILLNSRMHGPLS